MTESRELDRQVLVVGRDLIGRLVALFRSIGLYGDDNTLLLESAEKICSLVSDLAEGRGELELAVRQDSIYVASQRIREASIASSSYQRLLDILRGSHVQSVSIEEQVEPHQLLTLARLIAETSRGERTPEEMITELKVRGVSGIELVLRSEGEEPLPGEIGAEQVARRIYLRSISVVKTIFHEMKNSNHISSRRVKRVVQEMIQSMDSDPTYLMNLSTLKNYDEYTFNHSVNVSVLAIALGRQIGLVQRQLYAIGQAGMLHDLGKLCIPKSVLNKPGRLLPAELQIIREHPVDGFVSIAARLGVNEETIGVALACYEHHLNEDGTGYPEVASKRAKGLLSQIVSVVDRYDAMTSVRVYRGEPIPPPKALSIMYNTQSSHHDPLVLRHFMILMGYYPLGTVTELSDASVGVVVEGPRDPELRHMPVVQLVLNPAGQPASGVIVDLATKAQDREPLTIASVVDPGDYGIEPMDYIL